MKIYELVNILENRNPYEEVYIETEDGVMHEIGIQEREETFDGLETVYEGGINLTLED